MEKIFLIGGSGFIGKNLVRCLSPYYQISIFDKYIDHDFFADYPSVNVYQLDLVADNIPSEIIAPDYIINLASIVTAERDLSLFDKLISSNLKVLLNLYERFKDTSSLKLFRGASTLFLGTIAVSLYTNLNSIMVGALGTMEAVGFFTTGNKVVSLVMTIITAVTSTIIPRMSYLVGNGKEEEAVFLQKKTINLLNYMSLPMIAGLVILAKPIILVFSGEEFLPSVIVLQILSFLLIVIPWSSFLGLQILYPIRKEKYGNYAVIIGALVNLVLNFFLIPRYAYVGVAVSVVCAETVITLAHYIFAMKYMKLKLHDFIPIKSVVSTLVMALVVYVCSSYSDYPVCVVVWAIVGALVYVGTLLLMKDKFMKEMIFKIINR